MITKNSSGTSLSANYDTAVATSPRQWQAQLYLNGTQLSCGIKRLEITKGACGDTESFAVGNVYASMMTAELLELSTDIKGEDIEVRIGLLTGVGTWEWITAGWFTAIEVVKTVYSTNVTAYGFSISKTAGSFVVPATLSLYNIANAIQTATGKTVTFDTGINTAYVLEGEIESTSCYVGLQILAHAVGGYAVDTYDGNFAIHKFSDTSTLSVATDRMIQLPNIEEQAFTITGVQVTATGQYSYSLTTDVAIDPDKTYYTRSGTAPDYVYTEVEEPDVADIGTYYEQFEVVYTSGSPIVLYDENPNMSADVFGIYDDIVGYSYYTGTIDLSMGDIRIEGNDVLTVTDVDSNTYIVPCHIVKHTYDGGLATSIQAVKATNDGDGIVSNAPISQQIDQISVATQIAKQSAESAVQYAEIAKQTTDEIVSYADTVGKTVTQVLQDGETARTSAQQASEYASRALGNLSTVQSVAETLTWITQHGTMTLTSDVALDPTHVYFVLNDATGYYTVGAHKYDIVVEPDVADIGTYYVLTIDESLNNYVGTHLALDSEGLWLLPASSGTNKVLIATGAGSTYTTAGTYIIGASGETLARFATNGLNVTTVDSNNNVVEIANLGYGSGNASGGGTDIAPYYTLGARKSGSAVGNWSVAEGYRSEASGYCSHAEGEFTTANAESSHAEGAYTTASDYGAHAEGSSTTASNVGAHAEGSLTTAGGAYSHAQNEYTKASKRSQTALGTYNIEDTSATTTHPSGTVGYGEYAVIVGNGRNNNNRSNALTVDWNGNVVASGDITDGNGNVLSSKADKTSIPVVDGGYETMGTISTNSYADKTVTFNKTFASAPNVVACLSTTGTAGNIGNVSVAVNGISKTGCTVRVFNNRGSSLSPAIEWIAVGV